MPHFRLDKYMHTHVTPPCNTCAHICIHIHSLYARQETIEKWYVSKFFLVLWKHMFVFLYVHVCVCVCARARVHIYTLIVVLKISFHLLASVSNIPINICIKMHFFFYTWGLIPVLNDITTYCHISKQHVSIYKHEEKLRYVVRDSLGFFLVSYLFSYKPSQGKATIMKRKT